MWRTSPEEHYFSHNYLHKISPSFFKKGGGRETLIFIISIQEVTTLFNCCCRTFRKPRDFSKKKYLCHFPNPRTCVGWTTTCMGKDFLLIRERSVDWNSAPVAPEKAGLRPQASGPCVRCCPHSMDSVALDKFAVAKLDFWPSRKKRTSG